MREAERAGGANVDSNPNAAVRELSTGRFISVSPTPIPKLLRPLYLCIHTHTRTQMHPHMYTWACVCVHVYIGVSPFSSARSLARQSGRSASLPHPRIPRVFNPCRAQTFDGSTGNLIRLWPLALTKISPLRAAALLLLLFFLRKLCFIHRADFTPRTLHTTSGLHPCQNGPSRRTA